jgi:hypothetical protein
VPLADWEDLWPRGMVLTEAITCLSEENMEPGARSSCSLCHLPTPCTHTLTQDPQAIENNPSSHAPSQSMQARKQTLGHEE